MSSPETRTLRVSTDRLRDMARVLRDAPTLGDADDWVHLTDEQVIACGMTPQGSASILFEEGWREVAGASIDDARGLRHAVECDECSSEIDRVRSLAGVWADRSAVTALEARLRSALWPAASESKDPIGRLFETIASPFAVSLRSMMLPQGAYGETKEEETTSTLEFFITQDGKIVDGLRGLLKRVNREYYIRVFAIDPGARTRYGDRKALISISDTYQERPILHRKIDIGVTVLLGTDFRLTDNSSLAVEMLPF